jgi:hypothetical protein
MELRRNSIEAKIVARTVGLAHPGFRITHEVHTKFTTRITMIVGLSWFLVGAGRELRLLGRQIKRSRGYCLHKWIVRFGLLALAASLFAHLPAPP